MARAFDVVAPDLGEPIATVSISAPLAGTSAERPGRLPVDVVDVEIDLVGDVPARSGRR